MNTQTWTIGLIIYFLGITIVSTILAPAFASEFGYNPVSNPVEIEQYAADINESVVAEPSILRIGDYVKIIFSIWFWDVDVVGHSNWASFLWIFRTIFIYIPMTVLFLMIVMIIRGL